MDEKALSETLVDLGALRCHCAGDEALMHEVLILARGELDRLRREIAVCDTLARGRADHALRGLAATLHAGDLARACALAETGDRTQLDASIARILDCLLEMTALTGDGAAAKRSA